MAVYTEISDEDLSRFVAGYRLGAVLSVKGIAEGVENSNYLLHTSSGSFILTLYEKRVQRADLPFFLGLMEHLAARGVTCPTPLRDERGEHVGELSGRPAAIVTFLDGVWVRRPKVLHCHAVGAALARLHLAGADFAIRRRNGLGLTDWRPLYLSFAARADEIAPGLSSIISSELDELERHWPLGLPEGVIHADLFPDNVFFLAERLSGLIDFYFACNDAFAYDLAVAVNAWCFEPGHVFSRDKALGLFAGYESVRRLSAAERQAIPLLARGAALRFLLTRAYDWINHPKDALGTPHDPKDFIDRLKFHQSADSPKVYGLEA